MPSQAGDQRGAAAIEPQRHHRAAGRADVGDGGGQHVEGAQPLRSLQRDHHVARPDEDAKRRSRGEIEPGDAKLAGGRLQDGQIERGVVAGDARVEHGAGVDPAGERLKIEAAHDLRDRPGGGDPAVGDQHQRGRQPRHLGQRMADINDGDPLLVAQRLDVGQDLALARLVERREQGAADGDALLFAARQQGGAAAEQCLDAEQRHDVVEPPAALGRRREPAAIEQVLAHRQVREQPSLLEDIADAAPMRRHEDPLGGVEQHPSVEDDAALLRPHQAGDDADERGLAAARAAEQRGEAAVAAKAGVELEIAEPVPGGDLEHQSPCTRRVTWRASSSEASRATSEIATATSVSRRAPTSPPGTWVRV